MKQGSCRIGKPKGMTCELEYKAKKVYEHTTMNVIYSIHERE